jgi:hypothetical protein
MESRMSFESHVFCRLALVAACLLAGGRASVAQTPDPASIWTLQDENASVGASGGVTDRYYTNGVRLGYTSPADAVPGFARWVSDTVWGAGTVRFSFDLSQQIYTPDNTAASPPPPDDRPYAGVLLGTFGLLRDVPDSRSVLALSLGLIGPDALGQQVQDGFHSIIGQGHPAGWHDQIQDEPLAQLTAGRIWRLPMAWFGALETDALPDLALGVGSLRDYAQGGLVVRLGQGLGSDYGAARIAPGPSGADAFTPTRRFAWYVFAGADGQAVGHDITLNGNDFRSGPSVYALPLVGEVEGGVGIMAFGARLTYTHVLQSPEFPGQKGGLHQFGSFALSMRF